MMNELSTAGGALGGITSMLSKLGNIKGNMTSALNFENIKMNVFPFELPPNKAVSDYYQFCSGGSGQKQSQLPSKPAIMKAVDRLEKLFLVKLLNSLLNQQKLLLMLI